MISGRISFNHLIKFALSLIILLTIDLNTYSQTNYSQTNYSQTNEKRGVRYRRTVKLGTVKFGTVKRQNSRLYRRSSNISKPIDSALIRYGWENRDDYLKAVVESGVLLSGDDGLLAIYLPPSNSQLYDKFQLPGWVQNFSSQLQSKKRKIIYIPEVGKQPIPQINEDRLFFYDNGFLSLISPNIKCEYGVFDFLEKRYVKLFNNGSCRDEFFKCLKRSDIENYHDQSDSYARFACLDRF